MELSNLRMLELNAVELQKLHSLDIHGQRFSATLWMEFLIRGGRNDPDLMARGSVFPIGPDGKPTFKPSAGWLMEQADFRNALSVRTIDNKMMTRGDDVVLVMRYEGVFTEIYELSDFPVDQQGLTITLNINCRTTGPMPIELFVGEQCTLSMECAVLCPPARQWTLAPELRVLAHRIGSGDRKFPALSFTARVYRMPRYFVLYMGAPPCLFSLLAVLQNFVGLFLGKAGAHPRAQLSLMLVLTASAYQMAISNKLPPVSYLTLLDRWLLYNYLIIIVVALQSRVVSFFVPSEAALLEETTDTPDHVLSFITAAFWLLVNAYFLFVLWQKWHKPVIRDEFLANPDATVLTDMISRHSAVGEDITRQNSGARLRRASMVAAKAGAKAVGKAIGVSHRRFTESPRQAERDEQDDPRASYVDRKPHSGAAGYHKTLATSTSPNAIQYVNNLGAVHVEVEPAALKASVDP